jgi:hypothetical protein
MESLPRTPWSPVGYHVVEITDPANPTVPNPPAAPSAPKTPALGRAVLVSEDTTPPEPRTVPRRRNLGELSVRRRCAPAIWAPLFVVGGFLTLSFMVITVAHVFSNTPRVRTKVIAVAPAPIPGREVFVPADLAAMKPAAVVNVPAIEAPVRHGADLVADAVLLPKAAECKECKKADPAGRETFGTKVEFARNPREALRTAEQEGKLAFLLHVSGEFEDAGFT